MKTLLIIPVNQFFFSFSEHFQDFEVKSGDQSPYYAFSDVHACNAQKYNSNTDHDMIFLELNGLYRSNLNSAAVA